VAFFMAIGEVWTALLTLQFSDCRSVRGWQCHHFADRHEEGHGIDRDSDQQPGDRRYRGRVIADVARTATTPCGVGRKVRRVDSRLLPADSDEVGAIVGALPRPFSTTCVRTASSSRLAQAQAIPSPTSRWRPFRVFLGQRNIR